MPNTLDVSNYDSSTFDAQGFLDAGIEQLIVGCQNPAVALSMIQKAQALGLPVRATYAFLYFGLDSTGQTQAAILVAQEMNIQHVILDVESVPPYERAGITPAERIAELRQCVRMVEQAGLSPIIYTGAWYWPSYMADTTEFSHLPLHHAAYLDYNGSPYEVRSVGYGGWTDVWIHQYTSTRWVAGRNRDDNNVFIAPWSEEMGATPNEREMIYGLVDLLIGRADGIEYTNDIDRLIALRAAVGNDQRFNLGLALTQQKVGELAAEVAALTEVSPPDSRLAAIQVKVADISKALGSAADAFNQLGSVPSPKEAAAVAAALDVITVGAPNGNSGN